MIINTYRYWAFISYSSKDLTWAKWLHAALETYRIPSSLVGLQIPTIEPAPKRFNPIFRDRDELPASSDLGSEIENALAASRYLIVICSPNSASSLWVDKEIQIFRTFGRNNRIFALIVEGEPNSRNELECFPPALRQMQPLAADARPHSDGKEDAKLKLLSGMLGIGFDTLKLRDTKRRILRLQITIVVVTIIFLVISGLGWMAYNNSKLAFSEGLRADAISLEPTELVEFMLFDLRDSLEPLGQFDLIVQSQEQVKEYFSRQKSTHRSVLQLIEVIFKNRINRGDKYLGLHQLDAALTTYRGALKVLDWTVQTFPKFEYSEQMSECHEKIGNVLVMQGKLDEALGEYGNTLDLIQNNSNKNPADKWLKRDLWKIHERIGDILMKEGKLEAAVWQYRKALTLTQGLVEPYFSDDGWSQRDVLVLHLRVGDTFLAKGKFDAALNEYQAALNIAQDLIKQDKASIPTVVRWFSKRLGKENPPEQVWLNDLVISRLNIGHVLARSGKLDEALGEYRTVSNIIKYLTEQYPNDVNPHRYSFYSYCYIGDVLLAQKRTDAALNEYSRALKIAKYFEKQYPDNPDWKYNLWVSNGAVSMALMAQEKLVEALVESRKTLGVAQSLANQDHTNAEWQHILVMSHVQIGDILTKHGKLDAALKEYHTALEIAQLVAQQYPNYASSRNDVTLTQTKLANFFQRKDGE